MKDHSHVLSITDNHGVLAFTQVYQQQTQCKIILYPVTQVVSQKGDVDAGLQTDLHCNQRFSLVCGAG